MNYSKFSTPCVLALLLSACLGDVLTDPAGQPADIGAPLFASHGGSDITVDAVSSAGSANSSSSWSHTIADGADRMLVVGFGIETAGDADVVTTNVTYGGVGLTRAGTATVAGWQLVEIWYLLDAALPSAGTYTIEITTGATVREINAGAVSLFGTRQDAPEAVATNTLLSSTTISTNITTVSDHAMVIDVVGSGHLGTFTPAAGQTERWDETVASAAAAMSTQIVETAGAVTATQTQNRVANRLAHVAVSVAPAATGSPGPPGNVVGVSSASIRATSLTWSHTIAGGTDRMLLVGVGIEGPNPTQTVVDVRYGGVSLTRAAAQDAGGFQLIEVWYLLDGTFPAPGTYPIDVITTGTDVLEINAGAITLAGVRQATAEAIAQNSNLSQAQISTTVTTLSDNAIVVDLAGSGTGGNWTSGAGQQEHWDEANSSAAAVMSTLVSPVPGPVTMTQSKSLTSNRMAHIVLSIAPAGGGGGPGLVPGFHWRRKVVPTDPPATGPFDPTLSPAVEICELSGSACATTIVTYNMTTPVSGGLVRVDVTKEVYKVLFRSDRFTLDPAKFYRILVRVAGQIVGTRDIDLVNTATEAGQVDQNLYTPLVNGATLNIKFRLEEPAQPTGPVAVADDYVTPINTTVSRDASDQTDLLDNDDRGSPVAPLVSFGGGSLGGDASSNTAGTTITPLPQGSGSLTVNADGSFSLTPPTGFLGDYTFDYTIQNAAGSSTATVTISVVESLPSLVFYWRRPVVPTDPTPTGPFDPTQTPELDVCELSGTTCVSTIVTYNTFTTVKGGLIRVDLAKEVYRVLFRTDRFTLDPARFYRLIARVGSQVLGTRDVDIVNTQAEADAVDQNLYLPIVNGTTVNIKFRIEQGDPSIPPLAQADGYTTVTNTPISRAASDPDDLLDNDDRGLPAAGLTTFGGGDLGGSVTTHAAGSTISPLPQGSGSLTVNADGSFSLSPPIGFFGAYDFDYQIENPAGSSVAGVTITVGLVADDSYTATGNIAIAVSAANGVLVNDAGVQVATVQGSAGNVGNPTATDQAGRNGVTGFVTLNADGSFGYEPPPGFEGTDTFTYTTNSGPDAATVSIGVSNMVWFIDNTAGGSNIGTFSNPFRTIGAFNAATGGTQAAPDAKAGDVIALRSGTYSEVDGINLLDMQALVGEAMRFNTVFTADGNSIAAYQAFAAGTGPAPLIEVTGADNHGIDLGADNTLRGLTVGNTNAVDGTGSFGIFGAAVGNLVVSDVSVTGTGGALDLSSGDFGSNVVFDELTSTSARRIGLKLTAMTGTLVVNDASSAITGSNWQSVRVGGGSLTMDYPGTVISEKGKHIVEIINTVGGHLTFSGLVSQAKPGGKGIIIDNAAGDASFADVALGTPSVRNGGQDAGVLITNNSTGTFTFTNLDVYVKTGASATGPVNNAALRVDNASFGGTLNVTNATLDAEDGPAIDVELTALSLRSVNPVSVNSDADGIRLSGVTGAADVTGGTITGAAVDGVTVSAPGTGTFCLNLESTSAAATGNDIVLTSNATSTFQLQNFTGNGTVAADVIDWVTNVKGNTGSVSVSGTTFAAAPGTCLP